MSHLQMFRELSKGKKGSAAHHLITVRETLTHRLQHGRQHPDKDKG